MSATVVSLPPNAIAETIDFLRRLASMMSGGRNAEMMLQAAGMIEALGRRALAAEQLYHAQEDESARNIELRQVAEIAADKLIAEVEGLKAALAEVARQAEIERLGLTGETQRLLARAEDAEARLADVTAELDALRASVTERSAVFVAVPAHTLRLARAQFNHLAAGFARNGDLISQTICEIGGCAIDQALDSEGAEPGPALPS